MGRFAVCKLVLHPQKTKIVYCKDVNRRGDFPDIHLDFLSFKFRARKIMWVKPDGRIFSHSFQPAASPKALTRISREIRSWALHHRNRSERNGLLRALKCGRLGPARCGPAMSTILALSTEDANR